MMEEAFRRTRAERFAEVIGLPSEALAPLFALRLTREEYDRLRALYKRDHEAFWAAVCAAPSPWQRMLSLYCLFCEEQWARFLADGMDPVVASESFGTFRDNCLEYKSRTGEWGLDNYGFISTLIDGHLIRIGRLQFQPYALEADIRTLRLRLGRGNIVLNIHIPGGEPLDHEKCLASYKRAAHFFPGISPLFFCNSWLLCPALNELLPKDSNLVLFQKDYTLLSFDTASRQAEERIFGELRDDPQEYPANNTLRRNARNWLMEGNPLGRASGILTDYYFL